MNFITILLLFQSNGGDADSGVAILGVDLKVWIGLIVAIIGLITTLVKKYFSGSKKSTTKDSNEKDQKQTNKSKKQKEKEVKKLFKKHLEKIRDDINADRVWIAKFHNGTPDQIYPGDDVWQMISVIEDAVAVGVTSEKMNLQNVPVLFYKPYLDKVQDHGYFFIEDIRNLSMPIYMLMKSQGIKSAGVVGMFDEHDKLKGVIGYDITTENQELNEDDIEVVSNAGEILVEYLEDVKIKSNRK